MYKFAEQIRKGEEEITVNKKEQLNYEQQLEKWAKARAEGTMTEFEVTDDIIGLINQLPGLNSLTIDQQLQLLQVLKEKLRVTQEMYSLTGGGLTSTQEKKLDFPGIERTAKLETATIMGASPSELAQMELELRIRKANSDIQESMNKAKEDNKKINYSILDITKQETLEDENLKKVLAGNLSLEKDIVAIKKLSLKVSNKELQERIDIARAIADSKEEMLRSRGVLESDIMKQVELTLKQLGIEDSITKQITNQIERQQQLNEEKRLGNRIGTESMKLFEIAQTEGEGVAVTIGKVLSKEMDFSDFTRRYKGKRELEVFKEQFGDIFKAQQA